MRSMQKDMVVPPEMVAVRRPHLSAKRKAGIDMASIAIAETPEARNEAV
jgi:hypothetical protein